MTTVPLWREALSRDEIHDLLEPTAWKGWLSIGLNWALIGASFALVAAWPNVFTILAALFIIGARQLGMAVLMHEASHHTLFKNRALNDWAGNWLCAFPVWSDIRPYRPYHLHHHAHTWTKEDPDLGLVRPFPITRASLWRKVWRDLSGQTGWKRLRATLRRDLGKSQGRVARNFDAGLEALGGVVVTNVVLLAALTLAGHPALYLLWIVAWMTTYSLVMRIRAIAEHAMVSDPSHDLGQTRTTVVRWWERLVVAPNFVNYHLEHHLLMTVPHYNLPRMHRMLRDRGALDDACVTHGYRAVLERAASKEAA
jgi:fatty acid desaturase